MPYRAQQPPLDLNALSTGRTAHHIGVAAVLFAVLLYNGIFFNRYFPITEGWFSVYAHLIREGSVPYRDFYLFITPLYPLQIAAFQSIFGETFIALRILGIVVVASISLLIYLILVRRFSSFAASVAAITATFYYQSGTAHITYDFIQFFTLYVLIATYLLIVYDGRRTAVPFGGDKRRALAALFSAGVFIALAFLVKQSNGGLVVIFSTIAVLLITAGQPLARQARDVAIYMAGMALPVVLCCLWLFSNDAFVPFMDQVVFGAIASKGTVRHVLFSWLGGVANAVYVAQLKTGVWLLWPLFAFSVIGTAIKKRWAATVWGGVRDTWSTLLFLAFVSIAILASFSGHAIKPWMIVPGSELSKYIIVGSTALALLLVVLFALQKIARMEIARADLVISATVTLGLVWGNGTSAGIGEVSVFLGFALLVAFLLSLPNSYGFAKLTVSLFCLSFILLLSDAKFRQPYAWWSVTEADIRQATMRPQIPLMAGFVLSPDTANTLEATVRIIQARSVRGESLFTFPNIPVFYLLADRWPHSKAVVTWFDFLPDALAIAESRRLLDDPPKIIVDLDLSEFVWASHERLFRAGRPMGQREIRKAIDKLTYEKGLYTLEDDRDLPDNCRLKIWRRLSVGLPAK